MVLNGDSLKYQHSRLVQRADFASAEAPRLESSMIRAGTQSSISKRTC